MRTLYLFTKLIIWMGLICSSGIGLILCATALVISPNLPTPDSLREVQLQTPLRIYTKDFKLIAEFGEKRRQPLNYEQIPKRFISSILAAEDKNFFNHNGVDLRGLARAVVQLVKTGEKRSGGSTITMQVARNFFLTRKQTFIRKFNEIFLALKIEQELDKKEIMELYVNKIYLGHRSYGIAAAAQVYYGKEIQALNLAQLAMIAGLPKAPSRYNPITNPQRALIRRNWILGRMFLLSYIDKETYKSAINAPITAKYHGLKREVEAPYLAEMVRKELLKRYGEEVYSRGLVVKTTISSVNQTAANTAVRNGILAYEERHGYKGPEGHIDLGVISTASTPAEQSATHTATSRQPLNELDQIAEDIDKNHHPTISQDAIEHLSAFDSFGGLEPALVHSVTDLEVDVFLKSGQPTKVTFEEMKWAKPFISINQVGASPKTAKDIVTPGDIIRIRPVKRIQKDTQGNEIAITRWRLTQRPEAQAALVSLNPKDGAVEGLVGGFDFFQSKYNRATQAGRQPGSSFKPFIYTAALAQGLTAATLINDAPIVFSDANLETDWRPQNSSGKFYGPTRLRQALYKSRNLVSIRLLRRLGSTNVVDYVSRFGFSKEKLPANLSLALGSAELTPMEIARGYTAFANGGFKVSPYFISSIEDQTGNLLYKADPYVACRECPQRTEESNLMESATILNESTETELSAALSHPEGAPSSTLALQLPSLQESGHIKAAPRIEDERTIYIIRNMMQDVIKKGTGRRAKALGRSDLAGKTGTTNEQKDAWFSGYNGDLVTTAWLGFDTPSSLGAREYGAKAALPIWMDFMKTALKDAPETVYPIPADVVRVRIDTKTGEAVPPSHKEAINELFRIENAPTMDYHAPRGTHDKEEQATSFDTLEQLF